MFLMRRSIASASSAAVRSDLMIFSTRSVHHTFSPAVLMADSTGDGCFISMHGYAAKVNLVPDMFRMKRSGISFSM